MKVNLALIGYGYWGSKLLRNMMASQGCEVVGVVDAENSKREMCERTYSNVKTFSDVSELLQNTKPDGVVIATPPASHFELAYYFLENNCHILVEKPLALNTKECDTLHSKAVEKNLITMVDHTYVYTPSITYIADFIKSGELGNLLYYDSVRINLGGFQPEANVLWDLAPHDVSILDRITEGSLPQKVSCVGIKHFDSTVENLCYATMFYENSFIAHLHLNWTAPTKMRQILIGGTKKMIIFDDNTPTEKVRIFDKGLSLFSTKEELKVNYRSGDILSPAIPDKEALSEIINDFSMSIQKLKKPIVDGEAGKRVVQVIEALAKSLEDDGKIVEL